MANNLVDYVIFDATKISTISPSEKKWDKKDPVTNAVLEDGSFMELHINYDYGQPGAPVVDGFYIQGPLMSCNGIQPNKGGGFSTMFSYDLTDPTHMDFKSKRDQGWSVIAQHLIANKTAMKMHKLKDTVADAEDYFKNPIYLPRDKVTNELQAGKNPTEWVKLNDKYDKTQFIMPDGTDKGRVIDWTTLTGARIKGYPLFHLRNVYAGGNNNGSLQVKLASMIIMEMTAGQVNRQLDTLASHSDADRIAKLEAELAALRGGSGGSGGSGGGASTGVVTASTVDLAMATGGASAGISTVPQTQAVAPQTQVAPQVQAAASQAQVQVAPQVQAATVNAGVADFLASNAPVMTQAPQTVQAVAPQVQQVAPQTQAVAPQVQVQQVAPIVQQAAVPAIAQFN